MSHGNARLSPFARQLLVERVEAGHKPGEVAKQLGVTAATGCCPWAVMKVPVGGHENCPLMVTGSARHDLVCLAACGG